VVQFLVGVSKIQCFKSSFRN